MTEPLSIVSELARQLYAGVIETPPWQSFLQALRRETASRITSIMLSPPGSPVVNLQSTAGEPEVDYAFRDQLFAMDRFVNLPDGLVTTLHDFLGAGELERDDYYDRFMRARWGTGFVLGADVRTATGYIARLRLGRGVDADDFGIETHRLIETLLPHLRQAVEIFDRVHCLQVETTELNDALDRLGVASFLLDVEQRVTQPNRSAEALFAVGDGIAIRSARLVLAGENAKQQLARSLVRARDATDTHNGALARLTEVIVIPRRRGAPPGDRRTRPALAGRSPLGPRAPGRGVREHAGTEQRRARRCHPSATRRHAGRGRSCSATGPRSHHRRSRRRARRNARDRAHQLYSIFRKTGLRRQSELVALIAQTAARLPHQ